MQDSGEPQYAHPAELALLPRGQGHPWTPPPTASAHAPDPCPATACRLHGAHALLSEDALFTKPEEQQSRCSQWHCAIVFEQALTE